MAFQQNNFAQSNQSNQQQGEKKKSNFRVGRIYGADGTMDVSIWNSDKGGCYCILSIKAAIGKDPSTGGNVYEQKMSGELPSIFMNPEIVRTLIESMKSQKPETIETSIDTGRGSKMSIAGNGNSVKITIDNQKTGNRSITFDAVPAGATSVHANFLNLVDMIGICYRKAITNKLDPEEFAMATGEASDEAPF